MRSYLTTLDVGVLELVPWRVVLRSLRRKDSSICGPGAAPGADFAAFPQVKRMFELYYDI
jgi:hypothetical protein